MKKYSLMLVDDDPFILKGVGQALTLAGYRVSVVESGENALELLAGQAFDLVITDLVMLQVDGLEVLKTVKTSTPDTPVIILTGYEDLNSVIEALRLNADDYLIKPCEVDEICFRVARCLEKLELHRMLRKQTDLLIELNQKLQAEILERHKAEAAERQAKAAVEAANLELRILNQQLEKLSITDELTGLYNYRHLMQRLASEFVRAERYHHSLALLMIDIDHFKKVNDRYGHLCGDTVLQNIAMVLTDHARSTDLVARYGGEELAVMMIEADQHAAVKVAEKLRREVKRRNFVCQGRSFGLTVSIGVAVYQQHRAVRSWKELILAADQALYRAKRQGRNQVTVHPD